MSYVQQRWPSSFDGDRIKENAFRDQHILVVSIDDERLNWTDRELLKQVGERLYGKARIVA